MDYRRIIPCLDVKDGQLVKGINFIKLKDVGDLAENAAAYSAAGADAVLVASIAHFGTFSIRQMKEYLAKRQIPVKL